MGIFNFEKKIGGLIGYLGLSEFWMELMPDEQNLIKSYMDNSMGGSSKNLTSGKVGFTSETPYGFLTSWAAWATSDKKYEIAEKMLLLANKYEQPDIDRHFMYNELIKLYYKQRETRFDAIEKAKEYCLKDIELFPKYKKPLSAGCESIPRCPSFQQLAIVYEKENNLIEAIKICDMAIKYGLTDGTKGGFTGRLQKLKAKINK